MTMKILANPSHKVCFFFLLSYQRSSSADDLLSQELHFLNFMNTLRTSYLFEMSLKVLIIKFYLL